MKSQYKAKKVTDGIYWVGAIDWDIRNFHGYLTQKGTTYNAYLVVDDRITLVDTVKKPFKNELLSRIDSVVSPEDIDCIISNHSELDHSGCLPDILEATGAKRVLTSRRGKRALDDHFDLDTEIEIPEKDGTLETGELSFSFHETPMIHWPESMMTYIDERNILFSQDGFGMHLASGERFSTEVNDYVLERELKKYFANILLPYTPRVESTLKELQNSSMEIDIIAPDHGPIWNDQIDWVLDRYLEYSKQDYSARAVVVYDTMWDSTEKMAKAIHEGVMDSDINSTLVSLETTHRSDVVTKVFDAGALIVGSPTLNNTLYPSVAEYLCYQRGLQPQNKVGGVFGSYGWSGEAVGEIKNDFQEMGIDIIETKKTKFVPDEKDLTDCYEMGEKIAAELSELCNES